jgi:peptidoglycan/LPS O-acetylase OafA/YrhL
VAHASAIGVHTAHHSVSTTAVGKVTVLGNGASLERLAQCLGHRNPRATDAVLSRRYSYTLYLEHLAIIYILQSVYGFLGLKAQLSTVANIPVTVTACILAAALSSRFLEHDLLRLLFRVIFWTSARFQMKSALPQEADITQR